MTTLCATVTDRHHAESVRPHEALIDHHLGHRARARAADDRPSGSVTIREVAVAELPALLDDWHRLVEMAAEPNIFAEPEVLLPALATATSEVTVLVAEAPRRDNPQTQILCGLLPLSRPSHVPAAASPVTAWRHQHAYLGNPLIRLDALDETIGAFLDHLDRARQSRSILETSGWRTRSRRARAGRPRAITSQRCVGPVLPCVVCPGTVSRGIRPASRRPQEAEEAPTPSPSTRRGRSGSTRGSVRRSSISTSGSIPSSLSRRRVGKARRARLSAARLPTSISPEPSAAT